MDPTTAVSKRDCVILWKTESITCICHHVGADQIEITITTGGIQLHHEVFRDDTAASQFAIEQMHAHRAGTLAARLSNTTTDQRSNPDRRTPTRGGRRATDIARPSFDSQRLRRESAGR
jgi:hypothetical protein